MSGASSANRQRDEAKESVTAGETALPSAEPGEPRTDFEAAKKLAGFITTPGNDSYKPRTQNLARAYLAQEAEIASLRAEVDRLTRELEQMRQSKERVA